MARRHIVAAGGIVVRPGAAPLVAVVQRRKDRVWVLPKGKLDAGEAPIDGARREVIEETGHEVAVHEFLGVISYPNRGTVKVAQFWRMVPLDTPPRPLMRDVRAVDWLPIEEAVTVLALPWEQAFLDGLAGRGLADAPPPLAPAAEPVTPQPIEAAAAAPLARDTGLLLRLWRGLTSP